MMVVDVDINVNFRKNKPEVLFEGPYLSFMNTNWYDIHPDGDRFLMRMGQSGMVNYRLNIIINWFEEIDKLNPNFNK